VARLRVREFPLWGALRADRVPASFEVELTARCPNDCRHCYINLRADDEESAAAELSAAEIVALGREAAAMGAQCCMLSGGEPLLRDDFDEIYLGLERAGLLVGLCTSACLVTPAHVALLRRHPPREVVVTVFGATRATYEAVTRRRGSFDAFVRGLELLLDAGLPVRLKAMALRSNVHEIDEMARFCRGYTGDRYTIDPLLHLRLDADPGRNEEIRAERLSAQEVVTVEYAEAARVAALPRACEDGALALARPVGQCGLDCASGDGQGCAHLFQCGAGQCGFTIGYDGAFRLCGALWHQDTVYDLRTGSLRDAWELWVPHVRRLRGRDPEFIDKCHRCDIADLCLWCPAHAALETGDLDAWVEYFCEVAHARAAVRRAAV
jgi:radical SAM protein with 4Fe4S-binding SPASM domain